MRRSFTPFRWAILIAFNIAFTLFSLKLTLALTSQQIVPSEPGLSVPQDVTGYVSFIEAVEGRLIILLGVDLS